MNLDEFQNYGAPQQASTAGTPSGTMSMDDFNNYGAPEQEGIGGQIARQAGLAGRYLIEGATAIPQAIGNAANAALNYVLPQSMQLQPVSSALSDVLTKAGMPNPQTPTERIVGDASRAVSAVGGQNMALAKLAQSASPAVQEILGKFLNRPGLQLESAAASGGAGGAARENGWSAPMQVAASVAGGLAVPAADAIGRSAASGVVNLIKPFTASGRQQIVGNKLVGLSSNPSNALANIDNADEIVPGSVPTTAQASKDYGLLATERGLRSSSPAASAKFAERFSQQNQARQTLLDGIAQDQDAVTAAQSARDNQAMPLLNQAKASPNAVNVQPVADKIDEILSGESGERDIVARTLNGVRSKLFDEQGNPKTDVTRLYGIRKHINDLLDKTTQGDAANARQASRELIQVRNSLDDQISQSVPEFGQYLDAYKAGSKPINQMEAGQDIQGRVMNAAPDTSGNRVISQAKWQNVVAKNRDKLSNVLSDDQMKSLDSISQDLDRGVLSQSAGKVPGSDTAQNLSVANLIGSMTSSRLPSSPLFKSLARPLAWVYQVPDDTMQGMMVDAMLDPKIASVLMKKATPGSAMLFSHMLAERARAQGIGTAMGTATSQEPR